MRGPASAPGSSTPFRSRHGLRRRHLGERVVELHRPRQRVGADDARRGARACSTCRPARRAATTGAAGGSARTCSPNRSCASTPSTGKRKWHFQAVHHGLWDYDFTVAAEPGDDHRQRQADRRRRRGLEAGIHLRLRSRHRRAGVADRGAPGRHDDRRPGRAAVSDAAVSHQAAAVLRTGHLARRCERSDAGDQGAGAGGDEEVPARSALHAAEPARHDSAAVDRRRRQLGRRGGFDPETGLLYLRTSKATTINQVCKNDGTAADVDVDYSNNCEYGAAANIFQRRRRRDP